ncbi:pyrrolo-quinoline quinone [Halorubrum californiense DSM 19288]|uniref:Pyrrolo-quinoline quinone n=1 Tax=Halorubrum californiense DSM 19288 TaxID=1227465 RepID=M0DY73_9EURY|nr:MULTISPECIES: PQQ-binding-like beta-propeller repeat protein [Halorubrum]ELZ39672.1 pyrrolo-quinoline quinone [Halorubrum californiense DSM 19288]TKX67745.1 hypothetical protein EXE40_14435 [Halorubrum sp. GN11GM_10-3_MGM]
MTTDPSRREFCRGALSAGAAAAAAVAGGTGSAAATDGGAAWPLFGYDERNSSHNENGVDAVSADEFGEAWATDTPWEMGSAYPVVVNGRVYCNTKGGIASIRRDDGEAYKKFAAEGSVTASPGATDDAVYVGTDNGYVGEVVDAENRVTNYDLGEGITASPIPLGDGTVLAATVDRHLRRLQLYPDGFSYQWEVGTHGALVGTPAIADGIAYVGDRTAHVYAVDVDDGTVEWRADRSAGFSASPAVADGRVFVADDDGTLAALSTADGSPEWEVDLRGGSVDGDALASSPAVADGTVYVGSVGGTVRAVDAATGETEWVFETGSPVYADPVVGEGTVYVGDNDGTVYAIDATSGESAWRANVDGYVSGLALTADELLATASEGRVHAYRPGIGGGAGAAGGGGGDGGPLGGDGGNGGPLNDGPLPGDGVPSLREGPLSGGFDAVSGLASWAFKAMVAAVVLFFGGAFVLGFVSALFGDDGGSGSSSTSGGSRTTGSRTRSTKLSKDSDAGERPHPGIEDGTEFETDEYGQLVERED